MHDEAGLVGNRPQFCSRRRILAEKYSVIKDGKLYAEKVMMLYHRDITRAGYDTGYANEDVYIAYICIDIFHGTNLYTHASVGTYCTHGCI